MKLTPNEEMQILFDIGAKMVHDGTMTGREFALYLKMRGSAFYDYKKKKRNPCMKGSKVLSAELGVRQNKIHPRLKELEKKGLIKPKYFVEVAGKAQGFYSLKFIEDNFSRRSIKYVHYKVNLLPGEKEARQTFKEKKRNKKT